VQPDRVTLTFLFSDIEGSTQLWEREPQRMQAALAGHDALARGAVDAHHGRLVRTMGDGVYAVFQDPLDGVAAAVQLQRDLNDAAHTAGLPLRVRIGVHRGEAEGRDGDYYGSTVNRAARIMSIGHGGQTLLSQAVVDAMAERLPPPASLLDLGRVRLRDLSSPERVWQLQHPELRALFPPLRSLESTPNNLAQQLNSFVGRERELAEVRQRLQGARLLTLLGMGGMGKSRLSVQLGAAVLDDHPDGVWLVELAPVADPRGVPQAVASVLGVKEEAGHGVTESLLRYVRDRQLLVILDNCEHLVQACAQLCKQLLQAGAGVKILASSRDVLQVAGEVTYQVPTLSVPRTDEGQAPETLMQHEAVRLFVERAAATQPAFALTAANAPAVADICHRLDGIPLALELAAARTRALSVEAICRRLSDRFKLLVTNDQTVLPRQRTLRALIDWSHDLLGEQERVLFRRLSVFAAGWTLEAAEDVCAGAGLETDEVMDLLAGLVDKSLVVMSAEGDRYRMLDTVGQYALEKLAAAPEDHDATRQRHLQHYLAFAETAHQHLSSSEQAAWLARLDPERENFIAAHACSAGLPQSGELGMRMALALRPYWIYRGLLSLGLTFSVQVLEREGLQARDDARLRALGGAGMMCNYVGRYAQARRYFEESLHIAREIDRHAWAAKVLRQLGAACVGLGDTAAASAYLEEGVERARELGEQRDLGAAVTALAMLHRTQGRLQQALPLYESALAAFRSLGDPLSIAATLLNLSMVCIHLPSCHMPPTMLLEVLDIAGQTRSRPMLQGALDVCAGLAAAHGEWPRAARLYGAAQQLAADMALQRDAADEAFILPLMAQTQAALGEPAWQVAERDGRAMGGDEAQGEARAWLAGLG